MKLPEWLILWVWQSLLGEIYPEVRAIALRYDDKRNIIVRYYLDRAPSEADIENIECVITNILAHTSSADEVADIHGEAMFSNSPLGELEVLDGLVYARKEY
jgi:hypothetical protein